MSVTQRPFPTRWLLLALLGLTLAATPAQAYDPGSTHAGMTQRAAEYQHRLHFWLKHVQGLALGAYEPIRLDVDRLDPAIRYLVRRHLRDLDPVQGYRPDDQWFDRAQAWLTAGSVLEGMPFSRGRNHFLDPRTGKGLHNATGRDALSFRLRVLDFMEGRGNFGGIWTGANFNLTGPSVLKWARDRYNPYRLETHYRHRLAALVSRTPAERRSHLAMALLTAGALLHLIQDMAVPAHVRNDFVTTYLAEQSNITLNRASAYEQQVLRAYGRAGIPAVKGQVPTFKRFNDFFTNKAHTGLADQTQRGFFSLGSLPKSRHLMGSDTPARIMKLVRKTQPYPLPRVGDLALRDSIDHGLYYGTQDNPYLFAYRVTRAGQLEFQLDKKCYAATAERLVPQAVRFSAGLLAYLLRGSLTIKTADAKIQIRHSGPALSGGTVQILWESASGQRIRIRAVKVGAVKPGAVLASIPRSAVPKEARRIVAALSGKDAQGEPLVIGAMTRVP